MHRDEVKIFRGNVETHLMRLERACRVSGAPYVKTFDAENRAPSARPLQLGYGRPERDWSRWFRPLAEALDWASSTLVVLLFIACVGFFIAMHLANWDWSEPTWPLVRLAGLILIFLFVTGAIVRKTLGKGTCRR
jgi:hypothetical protein